jgi:hypothetical protein
MRVRNAHGKDCQQASGASAQDFDLRELIPGRCFQTLRQTRRKCECATVRQLDNDAIELTIIAKLARPALR